MLFWDGQEVDAARGDGWVGMLQIEGPAGEQFLLFGFLHSLGVNGQWYMAAQQLARAYSDAKPAYATADLRP